MKTPGPLNKTYNPKRLDEAQAVNSFDPDILTRQQDHILLNP